MDDVSARRTIYLEEYNVVLWRGLVPYLGHGGWMESVAVLLRVFMVLALCLLPTTVIAAIIKDDAGRSVNVPDRVDRVLAAGPPALVLLYTLSPDRMVGWVRTPSAADKPFLLPSVRELPTLGRLTGKGNTANIEMVLATRPDIIIDVGTIDATYVSLADRVQEQTGIPYILIDGKFERTAESYRLLGRLLDRQERAAALADYAERTLTQTKQEVSVVPASARPRVYYGRGPDGLETGIAGSINVELLEWVGAVNVAAAAGPGGLATVSLEQVLSWNPDVILTLDPAFHGSLLSDARWAGAKAVREHRIHRAPTVPFGWFDAPPGANRLIGVRWLRAVLYPDLPPIDLRAEVRAFYSLFYQVEVSDAQLDQLLSDTVPKP